MLITLIQIIGVLIPLGGCIAVLRNQFESQNAVRLLMASFGCLIMNAGCLLVVISGNSAEAVSALKTEYLGNALFFFFLVLFAAGYLEIRLPKLFPLIWGAAELIGVTLFWRESLRQKVFGEIAFRNLPDLNILSAVRQPSAVYMLRGGFLVLLLAAGLYRSFSQLLKTDLPTERYNLARLSGALLCIAAALTFELLARPAVEIVPVFSSLGLLAIIISIYTGGFFSITDSGHAWVFGQMTDAYILTDTRIGFLDANPAAKKLCPALANLQRGAKLPEAFHNMLASGIDGPSEDGVQYDGRFFEKKVTCIEKKGKCIGYALLLDDDTEQQNYFHLLSRYNTELQNEVNAQTQHLQDVLGAIITGMASVIESRDNSTGGHVRRTSAVIRVFAPKLLSSAGELHIDEGFVEHLIKAAPMHDIGKIAIDDAVLRKNANLTDEEFTEMRRHPAEGARLLTDIFRESDDEELAQIAINVAHYHHECWDGSGYPDGLAGEAIPLEARVMALADVFDALVSPRCYKPAMSYDEAFGIIAKGLGRQFDPVLGAIFLQCRPALEKLYDEMKQRWGAVPDTGKDG